ncbi:recQ-mediated genome instability protein 1-like isoform X3 [Vespula maculifrons]|uniref:RecQ-mediated genome instability protein 1-like isoform X3 n=1 Tax=Vespula maculifrons TaxID=7453 RepID=A0ABD2CVW8_VESMC
MVNVTIKCTYILFIADVVDRLNHNDYGIANQNYQMKEKKHGLRVSPNNVDAKKESYNDSKKQLPAIKHLELETILNLEVIKAALILIYHHLPPSTNSSKIRYMKETSNQKKDIRKIFDFIKAKDLQE